MTSDTTPKGLCSASYVYSGRYAYYGFTTVGNGDLSQASDFWYNNSGGNYIQYNFDEEVTVFRIGFGTIDGTNNGKKFKLQFSTDGANFFGNDVFTISSGDWVWYELSAPKKCIAFRIYTVDNINVISGIDALGYEGWDSDISQDLSEFSVKIQNSMLSWVDSDFIHFRYSSGTNIGAQAYKQFDLTNVNEIKVTVKTIAPSYDNYNTPRWSPVFLIENTIDPSVDFPTETSIVSANGETYKVTHQGDTVTFTADVSMLTGNYWIVFSSIGDTTLWQNLYFS
jgi:hypothetical protein